MAVIIEDSGAVGSIWMQAREGDVRPKPFLLPASVG